ncbi:MAG: BMC domain-containing protein [Clostridiales bacterium]|nr:BMC domain-containing protein [Clostridiales bacterium]
MRRAIGMIEFKTVSSGITAADQMVKTASVELLAAQTVCPGKYVALIAGELSAVDAAIEKARETRPESLVSDFILGNPDPSIFPAINGTACIEGVNALGILETYDAASIIVAADTAAKTAIVELIELRIARGMGGKSYMFITGDVAACEAAIETAREKVGDRGMYLDSSVIPRPDPQMIRMIM